MAKSYEDYKAEITEGITTCLQEMGCQPILFVGSGISRRYFGGSNWEELLIEMAKSCPLIDKEFAYYKQSTSNMAAIGDIFADLYRQWAWGKGRKEFDGTLFASHMPGDIYLKTKVSEYLNKITPSSLSAVKPSAEKMELSLLQQIRPHAIITTNYDTFLEVLFPDYGPIIGQKILRQNYVRSLA
jgi:hypothetical protein